MRNILKNVISVRALKEIFKIDLKAIEYDINNIDDKTIATLVTLNLSKHNCILVRIKKVKGYKKEANNIKDVIEQHNTIKLKNILNFIYDKSGISVEKYTTKLKLDIQKTDTTFKSTKEILRNMITIMDQNISGIIDNVDTEFLHDFRVALRKTRTALTQLRGIFKEEFISNFKKDFSYITNRTNLARDLDIQYLTYIELKFTIPENLKNGLNVLLEHIKSLQVKEYNKLSKFLLTHKFNNIMNRWKKFVDSANEGIADENGLKVVGEMAPYYIDEAYDRVTKKYQKVLKNFNARNMHKMRIACKKLRYILEFFYPLYENSTYMKAIESLKTLQDTLGLYQDINVQKKILSKIVDDFTKNESTTADIFMTTGYIFRLLEEKQQKSSTNFLEYFDNFKDLIESKKFKKVLSF
jgi:CHAD domain-containing protein